MDRMTSTDFFVGAAGALEVITLKGDFALDDDLMHWACPFCDEAVCGDPADGETVESLEDFTCEECIEIDKKYQNYESVPCRYCRRDLGEWE